MLRNVTSMGIALVVWAYRVLIGHHLTLLTRIEHRQPITPIVINNQLRIALTCNIVTNWRDILASASTV